MGHIDCLPPRGVRQGQVEHALVFGAPLMACKVLFPIHVGILQKFPYMSIFCLESISKHLLKKEVNYYAKVVCWNVTCQIDSASKFFAPYPKVSFSAGVGCSRVQKPTPTAIQGCGMSTHIRMLPVIPLRPSVPP